MALPPNDHSIAECWNPHYHGEPFRPSSAEIFKVWYLEQYPKSGATPDRFAAAPLCVFGGVVISPYTCTEKSFGGTYAVCPKCEQVTMCGYDDETGLQPKRCVCGKALKFEDYFQPALTGIRASPVDLEKVVNPARDPAVSIAEVCALLDGGVPSGRLANVIAILASEDLLRTGQYHDFGRFELRNGALRTSEHDRAFERRCWIEINPTAREFNAIVTGWGIEMLKARSIPPGQKARKRLQQLLAYDPDRLKRHAVQALGALLNH